MKYIMNQGLALLLMKARYPQLEYLQNIEGMYMQYAFEHSNRNINHQPISEAMPVVGKSE